MSTPARGHTKRRPAMRLINDNQICRAHRLAIFVTESADVVSRKLLPGSEAAGWWRRWRWQLSMATRRELKEAVGERYRAASRAGAGADPNEFVRVTGYHRRHALRVLNQPQAPASPRPRDFTTRVHQALTVLWETGDRICGKDDSTDVLTWYAAEFNQLGMDNSAGGVDVLRHLFVLLTRLGMRESSGKYWEGRDTSANNTGADTAEADLFQVSHNSISAHFLLSALFDQYKGSTDFRDIFEGEVTCGADSWKNWGTG